MAKKPDYSTAQNPALDPVVLSMIGSTPKPDVPAQPLKSQSVADQSEAVGKILAESALLRDTEPPRSRRVQLVMQPDLHEALKKKAKDEGISVNEFVHTLLTVVLKNELEAVRKGK